MHTSTLAPLREKRQEAHEGLLAASPADKAGSRFSKKPYLPLRNKADMIENARFGLQALVRTHVHTCTHTSPIQISSFEDTTAAMPLTEHKGVVSFNSKIYTNSLLFHIRLPQYPKMLVTDFLSISTLLMTFLLYRNIATDVTVTLPLSMESSVFLPYSNSLSQT